MDNLMLFLKDFVVSAANFLQGPKILALFGGNYEVALVACGVPFVLGLLLALGALRKGNLMLAGVLLFVGEEISSLLFLAVAISAGAQIEGITAVMNVVLICALMAGVAMKFRRMIPARRFSLGNLASQ